MSVFIIFRLLFLPLFWEFVLQINKQGKGVKGYFSKCTQFYCWRPARRGVPHLLLSDFWNKNSLTSILSSVESFCQANHLRQYGQHFRYLHLKKTVLSPRPPLVCVWHFNTLSSAQILMLSKCQLCGYRFIADQSYNKLIRWPLACFAD